MDPGTFELRGGGGARFCENDQPKVLFKKKIKIDPNKYSGEAGWGKWPGLRSINLSMKLITPDT